MDAEIIAHRGSSFLAPENTRAAFELAWHEGADAVEGDFRLTADGKIVALHDASLQRTARVDRRVADCSLTELQSLDVGVWKGSSFAGQSVPTLDELLATVPGEKRIFVEIKCGQEIIAPLASAIERSRLQPRQVVLISLDFDVVAAIKRGIPACPAMWVVDFKQDQHGNWQPAAGEMLQQAHSAGLDGLDLMARGPIDEQLCRRVRDAGLELCVWTVDDPALARHLIDCGVQGITTNRPGWLREQLRR